MTQNFNRYSYALNNPLVYVDQDGEFVWFVPLIYFGIYAAIEYGSQVYYNYQVSNELEAQGLNGLSKRDIWFGRIDFLDVAINGFAGAVTSIAPAAAPWIMYGTPLLTNAFNFYGDGTSQNVFDGSIPIDQYLTNTTLEIGSLYVTNVVKTALATPLKDKWNPQNHTKYFTEPKKLFGQEFTSRSLEDILQQATASWMDYSMKSTLYIDFNPDRLWYPNGKPYNPLTPNVKPPFPNMPSYNKKNVKEDHKELDNLSKYLNLKH